jgi:hypothetical protein
MYGMDAWTGGSRGPLPGSERLSTILHACAESDFWKLGKSID